MFLGVPKLFNMMYGAVMAGLKQKGRLAYGTIRGLMGISGGSRERLASPWESIGSSSCQETLALDTNRICICGGGPLPASTSGDTTNSAIDSYRIWLTETSHHTSQSHLCVQGILCRKVVAGTECKIVDPDVGRKRPDLTFVAPQVMKDTTRTLRLQLRCLIRWLAQYSGYRTGG